MQSENQVIILNHINKSFPCEFPVNTLREFVWKCLIILQYSTLIFRSFTVNFWKLPVIFHISGKCFLRLLLFGLQYPNFKGGLVPAFLLFIIQLCQFITKSFYLFVIKFKPAFVFVFHWRFCDCSYSFFIKSVKLSLNFIFTNFVLNI